LPKPESVNVQLSPEQQRIFTEAVDKIKANDMAKKLMFLLEYKYLPKDLNSIDVEGLVIAFWQRYPTIKDYTLEVLKYLSLVPDISIGIGEAVDVVNSALRPVYENCGAV